MADKSTTRHLVPRSKAAYACARGARKGPSARVRRALSAVALMLLVQPSGTYAEELTVLSYNVHGTPFLVSQLPRPSLPRSRMREIGGKVGPPVDVAMLQEDFAYHEDLTRAFAPQQIHRGGGATFRPGYITWAPLWIPMLLVFNVGLWPLFVGDGLTTLHVNPEIRVERLAGGRYERCGDYVVGGNDCFAAKGFLAVRATFGSGAVVDVYNTHLEAGPEWVLRHEDQDVRRSQLEHLAREIHVRSAGHAVIVVGDFNLNAKRESSFASVQHFANAEGLTDARAWKKTDDVSWPRKLDHILYRSGGSARLGEPLVWEGTRFVSTAGDRLSDHPAVCATFDVQR